MARRKGSLRRLIEADMKKQFGKPIVNQYLWICLLADFLIVQLIVGVLDVFLWKSVWELLDELFDRNLFKEWEIENLSKVDRTPLEEDYINNPMTYSVCLCYGIMGSNTLIMFSQTLSDCIKDKNIIIKLIISRLFTVGCLCTQILYWKGMFDLLDTMDGFRKLWVPVLLLIISGTILLYFGCFNTTISTPIGVSLDRVKNYIRVETFFGTGEGKFILENKKKAGYWEWYLDAITTTFIELIAGVAFYSTWRIQDFWYANISKEDTIIADLCVSYCISTFQLGFQFWYIKYHYTTGTKHPRVDKVIYSLKMILSLIAVTSYFRGWWYVLDGFIEYIVEQNFLRARIICFVIAFFISAIMGVASFNHVGVHFESKKDRDGFLIPYFILTYYCREAADPIVVEYVFDVPKVILNKKDAQENGIEKAQSKQL